MKAPKTPKRQTLYLLTGLLLMTLTVSAQVAVPFTVRYENSLKGDMTLIANSIVNRQNNNSNPNDPYNLLGNSSEYNDNLNMRYVDIDSDPTTFSSSSAVLTLPNEGCNKIVYAGLYWSATYRFNNGYSTAPGNGDNIRENDFNQVKLKLPGGNYINISGEIIFDGFTHPDFIANSPYTCFADITSLVAGLTNPEGEYTVANIRATQGYSNGGGVSGGWTIFFVYENPQMTGRYITAYDGFAGVRATIGQTDIQYSGFTTLPPPFPVRAKLASAALEGDNRITGDQLLFRASTVPTFTNLQGALKPANNFFNSRITLLDTEFLDRTPNSRNTLGYDSDIITINNPNNEVLPNNSTAATLRMTSTQDTYFMFFNAFNVEIIEPDIKLVKTVHDLGGNDIGGANVNLGQVLDYVVTFQNIGNDDSTNSTIRDILPVNTNFISVDLSGAPGVTYTYNPATKELFFSIPDNLVEIGDPIYTIRIRVQVATTCSELEDACSNIIQNQAYSTYQGVLNSNTISDDPSFAGLDSCGFGFPGPANFLVDIDDCIFESNEILCGNNIVLTAANGYVGYQWLNSNGNIIGNTQSVTVSSPGVYTVINTAEPPCIGITQTFNVTLFGETQTNPVIPFADEVVVCPNDGEQLPLIFLCGVNDSRLIQTGVNDAQSIVWEVLNESSCPPVGVEDCANKNPSCEWTQVGTGPNFNATTAGQYRVTFNYQNGCFTRFYFNVFSNLLDIQHTVTNIICDTAGSITITNLPVDYEFQLVDQNTNTILIPYQANPEFTITQSGTYLVQIRQIGVEDGCVFEIPNIGVIQNNFQVNVIPQNANCNGFGSIRLQALNVLPQYYFTISGPASISVGPLQDNDYTFNNLNPGTYTVTVSTDDGCSFTDTVTLTPNTLNLTAHVSQNISCNEGNIQMNSSGGEPPYVYAVYSYNGVLLNPTAADYQTSVIFDIDFGGQGTYVFIMVDSNNCYTLSNPVTIDLMPNVTVNTSVQNVSCNGGSDGVINFTVTNANGYNISYELLDENGNVIYTGPSGVFTGLAAGNYTVNLNQTRGNRTCTFTYDFTITEPTPIVGNSIIIQDYTCITNSGSIDIVAGSVSGGVPPYQYSIDGITFGATTSFTGLTNGTYTITIRDANNCIATTNAITFDPLNEITDLNFTATALTCPALSSTITVTTVGGNAPFVYEIIAPSGQAVNNGNNATFTNLSAGTYTFLVTDSNGCSYQENYTIYPITPISVVGVLVANVVCLGDSNGAVTFTVNSSNPYNYSIVNGSGTTVASVSNTSVTTIPLTGLPASTYTITVTDTTTNCTSTAAVTIAEPTTALAINIVSNPITCLSNGNVTASATGGWGSYQYTLVLPNNTVLGAQTSGTFTNLTQPGTYTITVTDANGCDINNTFDLVVPTNPVASLDAASDLCFDANGATFVVNVSGGTAPYVYSLNGGNNQSLNTFSNLSPGNYTITVTDAYGCTDTISHTIHSELTGLASLVSGLDCTSSPDAEINVAISGGLAPYIWQVSINGSPFGANNNVSGSFIYNTSTAGAYQFLITDATGCTFTTGTITVNPLTHPEIISITQTQEILCNGESTGAISIVLSNSSGTPPFVISVVNNTTGVNYGNQTSGLVAGNYTITVTDVNSCTDTATITLSEPNVITYNVATVDITCNNPGGTTYGEIIVQNVTGGVAPYTYYVTNNFGFNQSYTTTTNESHAFQILDFGIYAVDVVDANGCSVQNPNIVIASPPDDLLIDVSTATSDCINGGTAIITVTSLVSSGNFEFAILETNTIPYSSSYQPADIGTPETSTFTGLIPGMIYTFVVHDLVTDCYYFKTADLPINSPSQLSSVIDVIGNVSCTGNNDGYVNFTFDNYDIGATSVSYTVYHAQSNVATSISGISSPLTGSAISVTGLGPLEPGTYFVLFTENGGTFSGCTTASAPFTITESSNLLQLTATLIKNDNCMPNAGQISAIGQYGTAPYQYQLVAQGDPAPTVNTWAGTSVNVFNVEGGDYIIFIKDSNDCIQAASIYVPTDSEPQITATVTNTCTATQGNFEIEVTRIQNGIAPYSYSINGGAFTVQNNTTFTLTGLISGTYNITINDANGCTNMVSVTIYPPLSVNSVITALSTCGNNDGEIVAAGIGGSGSYVYELQNSLGVPIISAQASGTLPGLASGDYIIIITDTVTGCLTQTPVTIPDPTPVTFSATFENVSCFGGNDGSIIATLGTLNDNPPYTYTLEDGVSSPIVQNNGVFINLSSGTYTITVTSSRGCSASDVITITEPSQLQATAVATDFVCDTNNTVSTSTVSITISDDINGNSSGTAPYLYSLNGGGFVASNTFEIVDNGSIQNLTVTVRDANSCEITVPVIINPLPEIASVTVSSLTAINCNVDETVSVTVIGGSGDFTFELLPTGTLPSITPGNGVFTVQFNLSEPGSYVFQITDNVTGCYELSSPFIIAPFDTIEAIAISSTPVICFGENNGTITFEVQGFTGAYDYIVQNNLGNTIASGNSHTSSNPMTVSGLPAGNLHIVVQATDVPYCTAITEVINVSSPANPLILSVAQTAEVTCNNNAGEVVASANGGWGNYQYQLENNTTGTIVQAFNSNNIFIGLTSGNYTVTVQDEGGCLVTQNVILIQPSFISANLTSANTNLLCNGDSNASISVINVMGGAGVYQYILNIYDETGTTIVSSSAPQTSPTFNGLGAGIYSISIVDGWDCDFTTNTVTVTEPNNLIADLTLTTSLTCTNNAVITASASGGTAPYLYSQDGITFGTQNVFNVGSGSYQIYVRDANNCSAVLSNQIDINPIPVLELNLNLNSANINCYGESTAVIIADASGGLGNYSYTLLDSANNVLSGPQTSGLFTDLPAGSYMVKVDSNDCNVVSQIITITDPDSLMIADLTVNSVLCHGGTNGSVQVTGTGGTGIIQYAISPNLNQFVNSGSFNNLAPGNYTIIVQDQVGCFILLDVEITEPEPLVADVDNVMQELCLGDSNGSFDVIITGGTAPYATSLNNPDPANFVDNQLSFSGLSGGQDYFIFIRDANGCETIAYVFLNHPVEVIPGFSISYECINNVPSNSVTITVNQDVALDVQYSLDGSPYQTDNVFYNLTSGNHTVSVQHTNGCIKTIDLNIDENTPLNLDLSNITHVSCFGESTGGITALTTGGTGTILFAISPNLTDFGSENTFSNLAAGTYTIVATDEIGCTVSQDIIITQPDEIDIIVSDIVQELCTEDQNASITIAISGGVAPYETSLNNTNNFVAGQLTFTGLTGGQTHTIYVRDANNCIVSIPVILNAPVTLNPVVNIDYNCNNNIVGNTVTVTVAQDVTYSLNGGTFQSDGEFTDVAVGNHTITVKHANGCEKTVDFIITQSTPITASANTTNVSCNGTNTGSIVVTASGGAAPLEFAISPNLSDFGNSNEFNNLTAGNYTVIVRDNIGCEFSLNITIDQPDALVVATANIEQDICLGDNLGSIDISVTGGTAPYSTSLNQNGTYIVNQFEFDNLAGGQTYTVYVRDANGCETSVSVNLNPAIDIRAEVDVLYGCLSNNNENTVVVSVNPSISGVVTYSLDGSPFQNSNEFTNLSNGSHTVLVMHPNGCSDQVTFTIQNYTPLSLTLAETGMNEITATATGGYGNYTYFINGLPNGSNNVFQIFQTGNYVITVRDSMGCEAQAVIYIEFIDIDIPNFFTPNDDGENDVWHPTNMEGFPRISITVHDRYGRNITKFGQNGSWDGKYNGQELPTGDYWYTISLDDGREIVGNVTLYR